MRVTPAATSQFHGSGTVTVLRGTRGWHAQSMTIEDRLGDAELLWRHGRREGALLSALVAVAATAQQAFPEAGDGEAFRRFLRRQHEWTISVEYRGAQIDLDQLFWKWLRCELVRQQTHSR